MSAAIDRIIASACAKAADGDYGDEDGIDSLCLGDWRDCIGAELFRIKSDLEALAGELDFAGLFSARDTVLKIAKDL